ncbi:MAG TPA: PA2778 family cysteine peptidase [Noviherbaspirillum sp.]|jgi:tetratricopeptide (TPR) repeat protein|uniref:PA2778 family cysteine peptidase n=1 Tax=Noviherbaspirillum sp. TaxID=1926288 RepID=UPI002F9353FC
MTPGAFASGERMRAFAALLLALVLAGCATPRMAALQQDWPTGLPPAALLADVPFHPQEDYQCGPAALAMAAGAAGVPIRPEQLVSQVYLPARQGSLQPEMMAATRRMGLIAYRIQPDLEALLREVAAGNPVIVLQNLSLPFAPVWHYAVAIGYDRARNVLILHSGPAERTEMSLYAFERTWDRSQRWGMLALAPARLPATADAATYAAAAVALERSSGSAAGTAYRTALGRWPNDPVLQLGAGNTAYAAGDLAAAAAAYRKLVTAHPGFADGWNNLAQALFDQGRRDEAMAAVSKAVALGGPRLESYRALQRQIQAQL